MSELPPVGAVRPGVIFHCYRFAYQFLARPRPSHTFAVLSPLPVTMRLPSGLNATLVTGSVCPLSRAGAVPVRASHTFAVLSQLPVTMRVPSGLNATLRHPVRVAL